jgi:hypothetical protein
MASTYEDSLLGQLSTVSTSTFIYLSPSVAVKDGEVKTDEVQEFTPGAGVAIDGVLIKDGVVTATGHSVSSAAVTATANGLTTGLIPATSGFVTVTSANANHQISLPDVSVGHQLDILVGATGCELISSVATHKVNDVVVGATNEAALVATSLYKCQYVATDKWVVVGITKLGAVEAALVPDAV